MISERRRNSWAQLERIAEEVPFLTAVAPAELDRSPVPLGNQFVDHMTDPRHAQSLLLGRHDDASRHPIRATLALEAEHLGLAGAVALEIE